MSYILYGGSCERRARKPHRCDQCGHRIEPGTIYHVFEGASDESDGPYAYKTHLDCHRASVMLDKLSEWGDGDELPQIADVLGEDESFMTILRRSYPAVALRFKRNDDAAEARLQARLAEDRARNIICEGVRKAPYGLVDAARDVVAMKTSTYRTLNGRKVGIEADDGEKIYLVHSDYIHALEAALIVAGATR